LTPRAGSGSDNGGRIDPESPFTGSKVRAGVILTLIAGLAISTALIGYHSFTAVGDAIWKIGWGLVLITALHFIAVVFCGLAWRVLFVHEPPRTGLLIALRWIRESVNTLLPVARVGGDIAGARLLVLRGTKVDLTGASLVADRTVEVFSQFFFALTGAIVLIERGADNDLTRWAILSLMVIFPVLIAFLTAQRLGLLRVVERLVLKLAQRRRLGGTAGIAGVGIHAALWEMYGNSRRLAAATFLHTLGWVLGVVQIWLALTFMGHKVGWAEALIVESLSQVVCTAAFIMPAALGAQEAGYMVIGGLFGIPLELGLALSVVKRLSDVVVGIPGLLLWQGLEGRHLWTRWTRRGEVKSSSAT
jgi:putative membrane protein